jgi:superfamily II DNA or RNA helicase
LLWSIPVSIFPQEIQFRFPWRTYQARVLAESQEHLADNHLHIVAAPGSGKTVLGLEVIRRLDKPALVLVPTLTLRDQWIDRFIHLFLPEGSACPDWISTSIRNPGLLTVATYQALHVAYAGKAHAEDDETAEEENGEDPAGDETETLSAGDPNILAQLCQHGIGTIVVDEAHHLRTEWWRTLQATQEAMPAATVVALTATPPYDVSPFEWQRYKQFCGPIDCEVPVPELVQTGDLCPHQDYIYFSLPSPDELASIRTVREAIGAFVVSLDTNTAFSDAISHHPWLTDTETHLEAILDAPDYFSSMVIFLNHLGLPVAGKARKVLGVATKDLPALNLEWLEILLTNVLFNDRDAFKEYEKTLAELERILHRIGAIERRKVMLRTTSKIEKSLRASVSKLDSIVAIVGQEQASLGDNLRLVILTDYIRADDLPEAGEAASAPARIGVAPIFERIRRCGTKVRLGALSGSLVIIPQTAHARMMQLAVEMGIAPEGIKCAPLAHDPSYLRLRFATTEQDKVVRMMTDLFSAGEITVLVGTKSLLGEGWDAPSINCLILASFVGSYMLSNQMRGRAIRTQRGNPDKTANIWHLVCIEPNAKAPSEDYLTLKRRFQAFLGVAFDIPIIENGMVRLGITHPPNAEEMPLLNQQMAAHAADRAALREQWQKALVRGAKMRLVEELRMASEFVPRGFLFTKTIQALFWEAIFLGAYVASQTNGDISYNLSGGRPIIICVGLLLGALAAAPGLIKALYLLIRYGSVNGSLKQIGETTLRALQYAGLISNAAGKLQVVVKPAEQGTVFCSLSGGTSREKSVYLDALQEVLGPLDNPRYIISRHSLLWRLARVDYHAIPGPIAQKKDWAEYFARIWQRFVGPAELIYTRTLEGRRILLKARTRSLSNAFRERSERVSCWK